MLLSAVGCIALALRAVPAQPSILSLSPNNELVWSNRQTGLFSQVEISTNLLLNAWKPFFYEFASNGTFRTVLPGCAASAAFYRVGIVTNIPDRSLVLHLPFDNAFSNGVVLDVSGYANHGLRYSLTNWPSAAAGPDGSQAGQFHRDFSTSGDYVVVPYSPRLDALSNGTLLVWAYYTASSYGASAIVDAGWWEQANSWTLGRNYSTETEFTISSGINNGDIVVVTYPDASPTYDTLGWHYYGVTWNGTHFVGYFDGLAISTNSQAGIANLKIGGAYRWIGIGCRNHSGTPVWGDDLYPNNGWMGGYIDDVRVYNRALSAGEVVDLYASFDHVPPSVPGNVSARTVSSTQMELRWDLSMDNFRVAGYRVRRDGVIVGTANGRLYCGGGLAAGTTYQYSVEAYDVGGNVSGASSPISVTINPVTPGVDAILDEADGEPWVSVIGTWSLRTNSGANFGYFIQDDNSGKGTKSVTYRPSLPEEGNYGIYIWYPKRDNGATSIPVDIVNNGLTNTVYINQTISGSRWNLLGTFNLQAGSNAAVTIRNDGTTNYVEADAIRFLRQ
ncbi:MAG: LamG-like jellyroll fold domain-containing protein [Verrucomicrobiota bacterium]|jgi:hypothetical protein